MCIYIVYIYICFVYKIYLHIYIYTYIHTSEEQIRGADFRNKFMAPGTKSEEQITGSNMMSKSTVANMRAQICGTNPWHQTLGANRRIKYQEQDQICRTKSEEQIMFGSKSVGTNLRELTAVANRGMKYQVQDQI